MKAQHLGLKLGIPTRISPYSCHIKGFLKLYASLLGLNVAEVLAFFRREFDSKKEKQPRVLRPIESQKFLITPAGVTIAVTLFLVLGFFSYLFYQYRKKNVSFRNRNYFYQ